MSVTVYGLYDTDGELLYIGSTGSTKRRTYQHRSRQPWGQDISYMLPLSVHEDARSARKREGELIESLRPPHNKNAAFGDAKNLTFRMRPDQSEAIDAEAARRDWSRSQTIARAIEIGLAHLEAQVALPFVAEAS